MPIQSTCATPMNAHATIKFLSNASSNGRPVRRGMVELSDESGKWLGSFSVFGFTKEELKERAYGEATINLSNKGYVLQNLRDI
jgi:hypothetical protein